MSMKSVKQIKEWVVKNWDKIPDEFKSNILGQYKNPLEGLTIEGHIVVLLIDRQKPSVEQSYDFDEERFGVNRFGELIWGFDSGCSCPSPWDDSYPDCYSHSKSFKTFEVDQTRFDTGWLEEANKKLTEISKKIKLKGTED
jgi:hypothetical protein